MTPLAHKLGTAVKLVTPQPLRRWTREYLARRWDAKYEGRPVEEVFSAIYKEGRWGAKTDGDFSSGTGSHTSNVVLPYIGAVRKFLESLPCPPSVVDLGCGDFSVGKEARPYCGRYVACDVVPALIQKNKEKFAGMEVEFSCLDIIEENLPEGDVVFLRQVLQHLNNAQILQVVEKLSRYKFLVLTEHLPIDPEFPPNRDKATGGGIRLSKGSGVVLTAAPFFLAAKSETVICATHQTIAQHAGLIKTTLYEF